MIGVRLFLDCCGCGLFVWMLVLLVYYYIGVFYKRLIWVFSWFVLAVFNLEGFVDRFVIFVDLFV